MHYILSCLIWKRARTHCGAPFFKHAGANTSSLTRSTPDPLQLHHHHIKATGRFAAGRSDCSRSAQTSKRGAHDQRTPPPQPRRFSRTRTSSRPDSLHCTKNTYSLSSILPRAYALLFALSRPFCSAGHCHTSPTTRTPTDIEPRKINRSRTISPCNRIAHDILKPPIQHVQECIT